LDHLPVPPHLVRGPREVFVVPLVECLEHPEILVAQAVVHGHAAPLGVSLVSGHVRLLQFVGGEVAESLSSCPV